MAGKPGRSGGARPGAGRKPGVLLRALKANSDDPMEFLRLVMQEATAEPGLRVRAAVELARLEKVAHPSTLGKKSATTRAARAAESGKFAPAAPPKLVVNNNP